MTHFTTGNVGEFILEGLRAVAAPLSKFCVQNLLVKYHDSTVVIASGNEVLLH